MRATMKGIYVPVPTPCDEERRFLPALLEKGIERVLREGAHGIYLCGGTGDAYELSDEERRESVRIAVPLVQKYNAGLIVHAGTGSLGGSERFASFCGERGAHAVASIPPFGYSQRQLLGYYSLLSEVSGLPVFVYDIPSFTHVYPTAADMKELLDLPGVAGAKISEFNVFMIRQLKLACPDATIFTGIDEVLAFGLAYGADGSIGTWANLFTAMFVRTADAVARGDEASAAAIQREFGKFLSEGAKFGIIRAFEALMADMGYAPRCFRKIRDAAPLSAEDTKALRSCMERTLQAVEEL